MTPAQPLRLALLGDPVTHSRSPAIHRAALRETGTEGTYEAIRADEQVLARSIEQLREGTMTGINVTMPLKAAAAAMADELSDLARTANSVNTLRYRRRVVQAHSTDAVAFQELFADVARFPRDAQLLVLGSGASARAALAAADRREAFVSARSPEKARELHLSFGAAGVLDWGHGLARSIVINATPVGMNGDRLPDAITRQAAALIDLPYGSAVTPAIADARLMGKHCADGVEFLARQARASFEWWTGSSLDLEHLLRAARNV